MIKWLEDIFAGLKPGEPELYSIKEYQGQFYACARICTDGYDYGSQARWCIDEHGLTGAEFTYTIRAGYKVDYATTYEDAGRRVNLHANNAGIKKVWSA